MKPTHAPTQKYITVIQTSDTLFCSDPQGRCSVFSETHDLHHWVKEHGNAPLLWVKNSDAVALTIPLPADADFNEIQAAIQYEAASLSNRMPEEIAVSYIRREKLPCRNKEDLAAVFDLSDLENLMRECQKNKLKFNGCASLQQILLLYHFSEEMTRDSVLLYFSEDTAFTAQAHESGVGVTVRNLSFGTRGFASGDQWTQRAQRRLGNLSEQNVTLYLDRKNQDFYQKIQSVFNPPALIMQSFEEIMPLLGKFDPRLLTAALPPPPKKDPRQFITRLGFLCLAGILAFTYYTVDQATTEIAMLKTQIATSQAINKKIKTAQTRLANAEKEKKTLDETQSLLAKMEHINRELMVSINLLSRYNLQYTRINEMQHKDNAIFFSGETLRQEDLSRFIAHFEAELKKHGLTIASEGMAKADKKELTFRYKISGGDKPNG